MGYRREDYIKVNGIISERRNAAEAGAERRKLEIYDVLPEIRDVDRQLIATGGKIFSAFGQPKEVLAAKIKEIEDESLALQKKRAELLKNAGYPADYTEPRFVCTDCKDTGFIGNVECACRKRELVLAGSESSGIGDLLKTQTFETFDTSKSDASASDAYQKMRAFADNFSGHGDGNLLLAGAVGVGKTHLSSAVAGVVIGRGFDVKYETVQRIMSECNRWQFHRERGEDDPTTRYYDCDLLIIDDLGTEAANQYTISYLYDIINSRISTGKSMIISTNLTSRQIKQRYDERIASRLLGSCSFVIFHGPDMRKEKLKGGKR